MAKEHWATKLKREKVELEQENAELKQAKAVVEEANKQLASELEHKNAQLAAKIEAANLVKAVDPDVQIGHASDAPPKRPDRITIYTCDPGVNDIRNYDPEFIPPISDDEIELRVETDEDKQKYCGIAGSDEFVTGRPTPTWEDAMDLTRRYIDAGNLDGKRIIVFDPYGFFDQFPELNIVKTHREHEFIRTEEGMLLREEEEIARQSAVTFPASYWSVRNVSMKELTINGESFYDRYYGASDEVEQAQIWKEYRGALSAEYPGSEPPHPEKIVYGFQGVGDKGETIERVQFNVACNPGQQVIVHFAGVLPNSLPMQFFEEEADQEGVYSPSNPQGAQISFTDER